uniref:Uncharacterized protein n=1 Tax=Lactuca sativa TaxID=4236 RepID=A0A9R1WWY3_LACSA|nr:hypothetical protein LSAT_V11C800390130 [Lactuca sativa]
MAINDPEHREEEEATADDEDTGDQVAPIVRLEAIEVINGEENEDAILDLEPRMVSILNSSFGTTSSMFVETKAKYGIMDHIIHRIYIGLHKKINLHLLPVLVVKIPNGVANAEEKIRHAKRCR